MYSKNPNIPSVMTDNPPALEGITINSSVAEHINTIHSYIHVELSGKICETLRHKIPTFSTVFYRSCRVYCKRDDSNKWKCAEFVKGQDGKAILV